MIGDASPQQLRRSESSQSVTRQMWDSSDPTRNPAPLPLPDSHSPISTVRTQTKISAAHRLLGSSTSGRNLSQVAQESVEPATPSLHDLVILIHSNLEILMKRSQNNARDLGKLRGDVKNPQAIEEIKRLLLESHTTRLSDETHDPERKRELDHELASKLDALLRVSTTTSDRPVSTTTAASIDIAAMKQTIAGQHTSILGALQSIQNSLNAHLPIVLPEPIHVAPPPPPAAETVKVTIDTTELQASVNWLNSEFKLKTSELREIDEKLFSRRLEMSNLESRTTALQSKLSNLVSQATEARAAETLRHDAAESRKDVVLQKKKSTLSKRALLPLTATADRRIVSLSNVGTPPKRLPPQQTSMNHSSLAPALQRDSPFSQKAFPLSNPIDPHGSEVKPSPHRPMQTTLRTPPIRKASWSRRVSQIFTTGMNKENALTREVTPSRYAEVDERLGSMRSFRSFSHR